MPDIDVTLDLNPTGDVEFDPPTSLEITFDLNPTGDVELLV